MLYIELLLFADDELSYYSTLENKENHIYFMNDHKTIITWFTLYFSKLQERGVLDQYLARALGLPSDENNRLSVIDQAKYVLTLDYTIKMLNIHERYECGVPVIIKGETGVGKTALVDMLSKLWSHALLHIWNKERNNVLDAMRDLLSAKAEDSLDTYQLCLETMEALAVGREVSLEDLKVLCELPDPASKSGQFFTRLRLLLLDMANNPASALLKLPSKDKDKKKKKEEEEESECENNLDAIFDMVKQQDSSSEVWERERERNREKERIREREGERKRKRERERKEGMN